MIATLSGIVSTIENNKITLTSSFIGFEIFCPQAQSLTIQESAMLYTHLHWSQEGGPTLFGFLQPLDKEVFLLITGCSGIGPKLGLSILEQLEAVQFLHFISEENIAQLSNLKNIGAKKAEQLCLALRNKVPKMLQANPALSTKIPISVWRDLQETLASLHYSPSEIKQTAAILREEAKGAAPGFDALLRKALQILSKR